MTNLDGGKDHKGSPRVTPSLKNYHMENPFKKFQLPERPKKINTRIHSPLHELIDTMRKDFGETATKGVGSFSYYLGMLKHVPFFAVEMWYKEIKSSKDLTSGVARCKVFWYRYKIWKNKKIDEKN